MKRKAVLSEEAEAYVKSLQREIASNIEVAVAFSVTTEEKNRRLSEEIGRVYATAGVAMPVEKVEKKKKTKRRGNVKKTNKRKVNRHKETASKSDKQNQKTKSYGLMPDIARILAIAVGGPNIIKQLYRVMRAGYGNDWRSNKRLANGVDQKNSWLKKSLATAYNNLLKYELSEPGFHPRIKKLYDMIIESGHTLKDVKAVLQKWGVKV